MKQQMLSGDESLDKDFGTGQLIMPDGAAHPSSATLEAGQDRSVGAKAESRESVPHPNLARTILVSDGEQAIREGTQSDAGSKGSGPAGARKRRAGAGSKHSRLAIHEEEPCEEDNESFRSASSFLESKEASDARTELTHTLGAGRPGYAAGGLVADRSRLREDPANYLEPARPHGPDSAEWLKLAHNLRTVVLDEAVQTKMREPFQGMALREEPAAGAPTTEETVRESEKGLEERNLDGGISEESYEADDALFYKNNYPYVTEETISSVATNDHDELVKGDRKDLTAWLRESLQLNQRTFNENEVIGNFVRDNEGRIKHRDEIQKRGYRDLDGQMVNEKGYLINEVSGAIRSRYSWEDLFIGEFGSMKELGELPMPYRLERYNFNPHKISGNFDFDPKTGKPIFLQNKHKTWMDKDWKPVN